VSSSSRLLLHFNLPSFCLRNWRRKGKD
jgi:hypothetical protein